MANAMLWGFIAGSALLIGAAVGVRVDLPRWLIALVMAFGSGALIAALSFELTLDAYGNGGLWAVAPGLAIGAALFFAGDWYIDHRGGKHRKRSGGQQSPDAGLAILLGAILDGVPESLVIGIGLLEGGGVGWAFVAAVFISNLPEGLSAATGLRAAGMPRSTIMGIWLTVVAACTVAAGLGYGLFGNAPEHLVGIMQALAAGAILTMLADTMMPEAFDEGSHRPWVGLATVLGYALGALLAIVA
jgi:ZIP family zinc transporter